MLIAFEVFFSMLFIILIIFIGANLDTLYTLFLYHFRCVSFYKKLRKIYNAKYIVLMESITNKCLGLDPKFESHTFFFVANSSFHIVSKIQPNLHIEIPFQSVLYHNADVNHLSAYKYEYKIALKILINGVEEDFVFFTPYYNHKIDKIYGNNISGKELCDFLHKNFKCNKNYKP